MSDSESEHTASSQPAENVTRRPRKAKRVSMEASHEINRAPLRLPPFWPEEPDIWFAQIEAQFENAGVTQDVTKYNHVVGHLDPQFAKEVKDVIKSPPATNRYEKLKTELVKRLSASQEKKVKQLLMHEELGDRKPSQFLRHLQGLAGPSVPEDFVRTIWSSRLPSSIQPLLASQAHSTLEALAELADRVQDIVAPSHIASTSAAGPTVSEMAAEIAELKRAMKDLTMQLRDNRSRNRSHSRDRDTRRNSRQRSSSRSDSSYRRHPQCWYHSMHGPTAYGQQPQMMMQPQMMQAQQRSGMGTGAAIGLGAAGIAAGGLAGYAIAGGFDSTPTVQATSFSESADFGGDDWMD